MSRMTAMLDTESKAIEERCHEARRKRAGARDRSGTTGTTVLLLDRDGRVRTRLRGAAASISRVPGGSSTTATRSGPPACRDRFRPRIRSFRSGGDDRVTNQRETTLVWDRSTSTPIAPAIVWQDRRTALDARRSARGEGARRREAHRTQARPLLRDQARVDPGTRAGCPRARPARRARIRNHRLVGALEAHRRSDPRHRSHQREPDALL